MTTKTTGNGGEGWEYVCGNGHGLWSPHAPLLRCSAFHLGRPCTADLTQVGRGSRTAKQPPKVSAAVIAALPDEVKRALAPARRAPSKVAPASVKAPTVATPTGSMLMDGLVKAYQDGTPLAAVAATAGVGVAVMREQLVAAGVTIRGRGRPAKR